MEKDTSEILEVVNFIKDRMDQMATKDDIAAAREEISSLRDEMGTLRVDVTAMRADMTEGFASIQTELKTISQRLDELEEVIQNSAGFSKEIDYVIEQQAALIERVRAIEVHLNIRQNAAA